MARAKQDSDDRASGSSRVACGCGLELIGGTSPRPYPAAAMNRLNRYILWQCLTMMVFITAALSAAVWLAQSLRLVDLIVNRGLAVEVFLYLALLILPRFLDIV